MIRYSFNRYRIYELIKRFCLCISSLHFLQSIDEEQQDLEEKGVALETKLRAEDAEDDELAMEAVWAEWFELVNRKNELFRREMELYHTRRMQVC